MRRLRESGTRDELAFVHALKATFDGRLLPLFDHVWYWREKLPDRKGQRCRVLARGALNSILVEFEDGYRTVTSRYAVRLA